MSTNDKTTPRERLFEAFNEDPRGSVFNETAILAFAASEVALAEDKLREEAMTLCLGIVTAEAAKQRDEIRADERRKVLASLQPRPVSPGYTSPELIDDCNLIASELDRLRGENATLRAALKRKGEVLRELLDAKAHRDAGFLPESQRRLDTIVELAEREAADVAHGALAAARAEEGKP